MARFGLLYLRGGIWDGARLLPVGWVDYGRTMVSVDPEDDSPYGAHWWGVAGDTRGTFRASGYEGQSITICPPLDLVVVRLGKTPFEREPNLVPWRAAMVEAFARAPAEVRTPARSGPGAGDFRLLQHGRAHAGGPPGGVVDALALAVGLRHLDELLLQGGEVLDLVDAGPLLEQVFLLLKQVQAGQGIRAGQLVLNGGQPLVDGGRGALAAAFLGLEVSSASR